MGHILEGKKILEMKIADDKMAILFRTDEGEIVAKADADCCSHTWVEHIDLPARGFPAKVQSVRNLDMAPDQAQDHDYIKFYGLKIVTEAGDIIIEYRNLSNGYYGGNLCWPGKAFYGGVHEQNISSENWVEIRE